MDHDNKEIPAVLVIDMVKDNLDETNRFPITPLAKRLLAPINRLTQAFRERGWPVVFPTDAFERDDFIFKGKMKPHSLTGTVGAQVSDDLIRTEADLWVPKPRFSAFWRTDLEQWLKERGVTLCAVAGITTNFCVLTTAMDALCADFKTVILEDCTTAATQEIHENTLDMYRRNALFPLFRIMTSQKLLDELDGG
ncbi:MAG: cysteine hydrolase family protein [Desulfatiglandales bacterium]